VTRRSGFRLDWKVVAGILISAVALVWALSGVNLAEVRRHLADADPLMFLASVLAATSLFAIRAFRWRPLLEPIRTGIGYRPRFAATCIGFMANNLLPARVGEFVRAFALGRMVDLPISAAFGTLVVERMLDALVIVAFLFIAMASPDFPGTSSEVASVARLMIAALVVGLIVLGLMVAWPRRAATIGTRIAGKVLPARAQRPVVDALLALLDGLAVLRSPRLLIAAVVWSVVLWLAGAFSFWLAFVAFDIDVPFSAALFLQSLIALGVSLPSAPGFFGVFEGFARLGLVQVYGVDADHAISFAVGFHIGGFIPITLMGLYYAWRFGLSRRELLHSDELVESAVESEHPEMAPRGAASEGEAPSGGARTGGGAAGGGAAGGGDRRSDDAPPLER